MKQRNMRRPPRKQNQGKKPPIPTTPKNRKERRAALKKARQTYGEGIVTGPGGSPQLEAMLGTLTLQDRLHRAIKDHHQGRVMSEEDIEGVVQVRGVTAAGIAAGLGWGEFQFAEKMRVHIRGVLDALAEGAAQQKEQDTNQIVSP
jgi:hypothetical protein